MTSRSRQSWGRNWLRHLQTIPAMTKPVKKPISPNTTPVGIPSRMRVRFGLLLYVIRPAHIF